MRNRLLIISVCMFAMGSIFIAKAVAQRSNDPLDIIAALFNHSSAHFFPPSALDVDTINNMPTSGTSFFLSFWYLTDIPPTNHDQQYNIFTAFKADLQGTYEIATVAFVWDAPNRKSVLSAWFQNSSTGNYISFTGPVIHYDGSWHHVMLSTDTGAPNASGKAAYDGLITDMTHVHAVDFPDNLVILWDRTRHYMIGGDWAVPTQGDHYFEGDLGEFYMLASVPIGLSSAVVNKFRRPSTGKAIGLGPSCQNPLGYMPNMCNRGSNLLFPLGPTPSGGVPAYTMNVVGHKPLQTLSDPCDTPNKFGLGCQ